MYLSTYLYNYIFLYKNNVKKKLYTIKLHTEFNINFFKC